MLNAIKKSLGNSKPCSPVARSFAYADDDLESNTSSIASSESSSTYYSTLTHLSEASDALDRQSFHSSSEVDSAPHTSIRHIVEDPQMLIRLRQISLNLDRRKKFAESLALLNEYREAAAHFLPDGHSHGIKILNYLSDHYIAQKNFSMAETLLIDCCKRKENFLGILDTSTIKSKLKLAAICQILGNLENCESYLGDCMTACINAPIPHEKLAIEVAHSLTCLYIGKGEYDEAESMITACMQMHQDEESSSFLKVKELLQIVAIRKEAENVLKRFCTQEAANPGRSPSKQHERLSNESDSLRTPIRIRTATSAQTKPLLEYSSRQKLSGPNTESPPLSNAAIQLQPSPSSSRSRPAYASASKPSDTVVLDDNIVAAWADYIETRSIPRDAPSIPLSLNIGVCVPPGFETHYKVAAFALAKSRKSQNK